jgi:hypothetical protein
MSMEAEEAAPESPALDIAALREMYAAPEPTKAQREEAELDEAVAALRAQRAEAEESAAKVSLPDETVDELSHPRYLQPDGSHDLETWKTAALLAANEKENAA